MDSKKTTGCVLVLVIGACLSFGVYKCKYYYSKWSDNRDRPWAYSSDQGTKLLVGKWEGSFQDPDKITKEIKLEIFEPVTEAEREANASKRSRKRGGIRTKDKRSFDGLASVKSKLGTEEYELYGAVDKTDYHRLYFNFRPVDEDKRVLPNFLALEADEGEWKDDQLTVTLSFAYHRKDGSSYSDSADPRHEMKVRTTLKRILP